MTHLIEKHNNEKSELFLKSYMPQWDQCKQELNNGILGYSEWKNSKTPFQGFDKSTGTKAVNPVSLLFTP